MLGGKIVLSKLENDNISLKEVYKDYFPIGAAIAVSDLEDEGQREILLKHFNSITPENSLKFAIIHPEEDEYAFDDGDKIVNFAAENRMMVRGHTFVWHNQVPEWLFKDESGEAVSKEILVERLKAHINTLCRRYNDKIYAWDVVNEAVEDKSDFLYRDSQWYKIIGEEYLELSFKIARQASQNAVLFYNDYNNEKPEKLHKSYKLLKSMIDRGVPIDGIGIQGHWDIHDRDLFDNLKAAIELYASLGVKIQITELDVSMFSFDDKTRSILKPADDMIEQQSKVYKKLFEIFRYYKDVISGVTFWGISDKHTWKDNFPVKDRKDWPLLFDVDGRPKSAFYSIIDF